MNIYRVSDESLFDHHLILAEAYNSRVRYNTECSTMERVTRRIDLLELEKEMKSRGITHAKYVLL